jgi:glucokinase
VRSDGLVGALDVGGTHVAAGRVHMATARVEPGTRSALAPGAGRDELVGAIVEAAKGVAAGASALGVAVPGPFDYEAGISAITHKLGALHGVDLRRELATGLGLEPRAVVFLNDAAAFLLGEWWAGAARGHARAVGITLGSGLGSAFLADGRIVAGQGELYTLPFRGAPVEQTISRGAILAHYGSDGLDVEQIAAFARGGEVRARRLFEQLGDDLAEFLAPPLHAFEASCLVVGGSIAGAWDLLADRLRSGLGADGLVVRRAAHLEDAALLGAALYATGREL